MIKPDYYTKLPDGTYIASYKGRAIGQLLPIREGEHGQSVVFPGAVRSPKGV